MPVPEKGGDKGNRIQKALGHRVMPLGVPWLALMIGGFGSLLVLLYMYWVLGLAVFALFLFVTRHIMKTEAHPFRALRL